MIDSGVQIVCIVLATLVATLLLAIGAAVRGADPEQEIARLGAGASAPSSPRSSARGRIT